MSAIHECLTPSAAASAAAPTLCLCMMVCNEARVIARALRSIRDHIDYWVICDNGSTDSTVPEILNTLSGIPGQLHRTTWVNFGHNRQRTLRLAQGKADYILIMDADMVAHVHAPFRHKLSADAYLIRYEGSCDYAQSMLVASRVPWAYVGVTHEYITAPGAAPPQPLPELTLTHYGDGGMWGDKFERDEALLKNAIADDPGNSRSVFYLAQTCFDQQRFAEALPWYRRRAEMPGWDEETWYSRFRIAECLNHLGESWPVLATAYAEAFNARPARLEPLHRLLQGLRATGDFESGYQAGLLGVDLPYPGDALFIDREVHEFGFLLEFAICATNAGHRDEAHSALDRVLRVPKLPPWAYESALATRALLTASLAATVPADDAEFFAFASRLEHDHAALRGGEQIVTLGETAELQNLRLMGCHATAEQRARRAQTFFNPSIASRRSLGQGRHDVEEGLAFADLERDPGDQRSFGTHLPVHVSTLSVRHKVVAAGETWNVSVRGDHWSLHPMEEVYVLLNIGTLVLEENAEVLVEGNVLSLLCQRVICLPGSRIALRATPFSVDARTGPHNGESGAAGVDGTPGASGLPLSLGGSILGPCLPPGGELHPAHLAGMNGAAGGPGTDGARGADGRNGGMQKLAELTFRSIEGQLTILGEPGAGGNGGDGGPGGGGGAGGSGADGRNLLTGPVPGGIGGPGGPAGAGGRGGHGGHGGLCSNIYVCVPPSQAHRVRCVALPGQGGRAGAGGAGGAGGQPGQGGHGPDRHRSAAGASGPSGLPGKSGVNGRQRPAPWIFLNEEPVFTAGDPRVEEEARSR